MNKVTFSIRIDESLKEQVRKLAFEDKISPNKWIEGAIKEKIRHTDIQKGE